MIRRQGKICLLILWIMKCILQRSLWPPTLHLLTHLGVFPLSVIDMQMVNKLYAFICTKCLFLKITVLIQKAYQCYHGTWGKTQGIWKGALWEFYWGYRISLTLDCGGDVNEQKLSYCTLEMGKCITVVHWHCFLKEMVFLALLCKLNSPFEVM